MEFKCTSCGICCKQLGVTIDNIRSMPIPYQIELSDFPYPVRSDKSCSKFVNGRCTVYSKRPDVCRVDVMHKKYFSHMKQADYFNQTGAACNSLMNEADSNKKRVPWHR